MKYKLLVTKQYSHILRNRKTVREMYDDAGSRAERKFRMDHITFERLHNIIATKLEKIFTNYKQSHNKSPRNKIHSSLRLSAALRIFAGGSYLDIFSDHGIGVSSVYNSVWAVVDAVNSTPELDIKFPDYEEQELIAQRFKTKSGAGFDNCIDALDGLIIWTQKPTKPYCDQVKIGEKSFFCGRKNKFGLNLQAMCDDKLIFRFADIRFPASASDYISWNASDLPKKILLERLIKPGFAIYSDNAYVTNDYMVIPFRGSVSEIEDAYNFYLSQLRITIERAFGLLVHRWGILRKPILFSTHKIPSLIMCLLKLHNFLIREKCKISPKPTARDASFQQNNPVRYQLDDEEVVVDDQLVQFDALGRPVSILNGGHHFNDCPGGRRPVETTSLPKLPRDYLVDIIKSGNFRRPPCKVHTN